MVLNASAVPLIFQALVALGTSRATHLPGLYSFFPSEQSELTQVETSERIVRGDKKSFFLETLVSVGLIALAIVFITLTFYVGYYTALYWRKILTIRIHTLYFKVTD